jgi:hypothetical protein
LLIDIAASRKTHLHRGWSDGSLKGTYALRRIAGDTAHFQMATFRESEAAVQAFAEDDSAWRNTTTSTQTSARKWSQ